MWRRLVTANKLFHTQLTANTFHSHSLTCSLSTCLTIDWFSSSASATALSEAQCFSATHTTGCNATSYINFYAAHSTKKLTDNNVIVHSTAVKYLTFDILHSIESLLNISFNKANVWRKSPFFPLDFLHSFRTGSMDSWLRTFILNSKLHGFLFIVASVACFLFSAPCARLNWLLLSFLSHDKIS